MLNFAHHCKYGAHKMFQPYHHVFPTDAATNKRWILYRGNNNVRSGKYSYIGELGS